MVGESTKDHIGTDLQAITPVVRPLHYPEVAHKHISTDQASQRVYTVFKKRQKRSGRRKPLLWNRVSSEIRHHEFCD